MAIEDLRSAEHSVPFETDVCLVGSGPAGSVLADELRGSGLDVLVVESGGLEPHPDADALNATSDIGAPLFNGRVRALGGTSRLWNGRCIAFDDIDYEARPWMKLSGWPVAAAAMAPFVGRAAAHLGAWSIDQATGTPLLVPQAPPPQPVLPDQLRPLRWETATPIDFGQRVRAHNAAGLRLLLHATATHLNTDADGRRVESIEVSDPDGRRLEVRARTVVLCAGGIENARILLYSDRVRPNGIGNDRDVVGRYFMDHPRDFALIARVDPREATRLRELFGPVTVDGPHGRSEFHCGFALSEARQREDRLVNCAAWPFEFRSETDPVQAARRLLSRRNNHRLRDASLLAAQPGAVMRSVRARLGPSRRFGYAVDRAGFLIASEQVPDADSRVRLSTRRDRLGLPLVDVDWRIGLIERASQAALARTIAREFKRLGLPPIELADWVRANRYEDANLVDGCHPSGTTRMANDPRHGVVDSDCRVHGVDGLYVAGSSVFPTDGHANPTLMIAALAVRLADHLRATLRRSAVAASARAERAGGDGDRPVDPAAGREALPA